MPSDPVLQCCLIWRMSVVVWTVFFSLTVVDRLKRWPGFGCILFSSESHWKSFTPVRYVNTSMEMDHRFDSGEYFCHQLCTLRRSTWYVFFSENVKSGVPILCVTLCGWRQIVHPGCPSYTHECNVLQIFIHTRDTSRSSKQACATISNELCMHACFTFVKFYPTDKVDFFDRF